MEFAAGMWHGIESVFVILAQSTFDDFIADSESWFAAEHEGKRYKHTPVEMMKNWEVLELQKYRVQCFWWVEQKLAFSYDDADRKLREHFIRLFPDRADLR